MNLTGRQIRERAKKVWADRANFEGMLDEIYRYVMPYRDNTFMRAAGSKRTDQVFDATAVKAAFRFAGRMQRDLTPPFQPFFSLEPGPLWPDDDQKAEATKELQRVAKIVSSVLSTGNFHTASHEMNFDLFAGTGALLMLKGDARQIMRFMSVPLREIAVEEGPWGSIWHIYWKRQFAYKNLPVLWPKGKFSDTLQKGIKEREHELTTICQYTWYDHEETRWRLNVFSEQDDDDAVIFEESYRTSPWLVPRFFVVPGESYGRGPAHLAMPFIKTTNKVRELALIAAAFAIFGLWMRRNDGVFNPDTARMEPKAMWTVSTTGGPLGPAIQRLDVPKDFDVSSFVIADEREQMKQALFDDTLPPDAGAVRSATEIAERMRRLSEDLAGVYGRLTLEIVVPLVQRVIDVLESMGVLKTNLTIDQLLFQVRVVSPIAAGQHADQVQRAVDWVSILTALGGKELAMMTAKLEELGPELGRWMGIHERFIRTEGERGDVMKLVAQIIAAQQPAANVKPPPAPAAPLNGHRADPVLEGAI